MPAQRSRRRSPDDETPQRAIMLQLLRKDHPERWSRAELESEIRDIPALDLNHAIEHLHREGVALVDGERVWACTAARHLDRLGLIAI